MDSALGWIGEFVRWLANWIPKVYHVKVTQKAVRFVRARAYLVEPGLHVHWPITTQVEVYPVVRQVADVPSQVAFVREDSESSSYVAVIVSGVITYHISDLFSFLVENYDAEVGLKEAAQAGIRKAVLAETVRAINCDRAKIDNRLAREVQKMVSAFGVEIESARLTSFAPTTSVSLVVDGSSPLGVPLGGVPTG